jgi:hypothetical protein
MPYKARLKDGQERKREKPTYRVANCHEYNQSLKQRGKRGASHRAKAVD